MDDISELFNFDIKDVYVAGVKNPFMKWNEFELSHLSKQNYDKLKDSYIAGGILIMNLKKIREDNIEKKMIKVIIDNTIEKRWNDQDVINIACEGCVKFLPLNYISYPYLIDLITKKDFLSHYSNKELFDSIINPKIIHYASEKPWNGNPRLSQFWWQIYEYLKLVV